MSTRIPRASSRGRCGTARKVRYRDRYEAERVVNAAVRTFRAGLLWTDHPPSRAYECPDCSGWHLTSQAYR